MRVLVEQVGCQHFLRFFEDHVLGLVLVGRRGHLPLRGKDGELQFLAVEEHDLALVLGLPEEEALALGHVLHRLVTHLLCGIGRRRVRSLLLLPRPTAFCFGGRQGLGLYCL